MKIVLIFHKKRNIDTFEKYLIPFFVYTQWENVFIYFQFSKVAFLCIESIENTYISLSLIIRKVLINGLLQEIIVFWMLLKPLAR